MATDCCTTYSITLTRPFYRGNFTFYYLSLQKQNHPFFQKVIYISNKRHYKNEALTPQSYQSLCVIITTETVTFTNRRSNPPEVDRQRQARQSLIFICSCFWHTLCTALLQFFTLTNLPLSTLTLTIRLTLVISTLSLLMVRSMFCARLVSRPPAHEVLSKSVRFHCEEPARGYFQRRKH